jgi:hypothetical protein
MYLSKISKFLIFGMACFLTACDVINPTEPIPSYLSIDKFNVSTDYATQGSNSEAISDVWVFVNDNLVGGYELPARIPILNQGAVNLKLKAGIKNSGAANLRREYPFYTLYENTSLELFADSVIHVEPTIGYYQALTFPFKEDFEGSSYGISADAASTPLFVTNTSNECIEGNGTLKMSVTDNEVFRATTSNVFILPKGGAEVYLEMDYIGTGYIEVRMIANQISGAPIESSVIVLYPSTVKKKIYLDVGPIVSSETTAPSFRLVFMAYNQSGQTSSVNYIDNLKLIHPTL